MIRIIITLLLICGPIWSQGIKVSKVRKANPAIIIKAPSADETVRKGSSYTIRWEVQQQGLTSEVSIQLIDTTAKKKIHTLDRTANNGSYLWEVSHSIPNGNYRILIFF